MCFPTALAPFLKKWWVGMGWHLRINHSGPQLLPTASWVRRITRVVQRRHFSQVALTDNITVYIGPSNMPSPLTKFRYLQSTPVTGEHRCAESHPHIHTLFLPRPPYLEQLQPVVQRSPGCSQEDGMAMMFPLAHWSW